MCLIIPVLTWNVCYSESDESHTDAIQPGTGLKSGFISFWSEAMLNV